MEILQLQAPQWQAMLFKSSKHKACSDVIFPTFDDDNGDVGIEDDKFAVRYDVFPY